MIINEISQRHIVFMDDKIFQGIYLNMHLIIGKQFNYLIDTGVGSESVLPIKRYLESRNETKPLIIINTHDHWDHVWGNGSIASIGIVSHKKTYDNLVSRWDQDLEKNNKFVRGEVKKVLPNLLFEDTLVFEEDGIVLGFTPAHSDNDIYVYDRIEKVLNVADNLNDHDSFDLPDLDLDSKYLHAALDVFESFDVMYVVSGHNKVVDKEYLMKMRNAL